jgi:hypothetical protein
MYHTRNKMKFVFHLNKFGGCSLHDNDGLDRVDRKTLSPFGLTPNRFCAFGMLMSLTCHRHLRLLPLAWFPIDRHSHKVR